MLHLSTVARALGVELHEDEIRLAADMPEIAESTIGGPIERAVIRLALERYPLREGEATCVDSDPDSPAGGARHTAAGCLVLGLATRRASGDGGSWRYGSPPLLPLGAGPIEPPPPPESRAALSDLRQARAEGLPPQRGRIEVAEAVMLAYTGVSRLGDADAPSGAPLGRDVEAYTRAAIDLAIRLLCDERRSVLEVAADAAATVLAEGRGEGKDALVDRSARARRMLRAVVPREDVL